MPENLSLLGFRVWVEVRAFKWSTTHTQATITKPEPYSLTRDSSPLDKELLYPFHSGMRSLPCANALLMSVRSKNCGSLCNFWDEYAVV